jgi:hypothetical protein
VWERERKRERKRLEYYTDKNHDGTEKLQPSEDTTVDGEKTKNPNSRNIFQEWRRAAPHHGGLHETTYTLKLVTLLKPYLFRLMSFDQHTRERWCGFRCAACFKQLVCYSNSVILYLPVSCRKNLKTDIKVCKGACTEISETLTIDCHVEVSALSGDWN